MARYCGYCGARSEPGDRVCGQCGKPLEADAITAQPPAPVPPENARNTKTLLWAALAGALCLLAVLLCVRIAALTGYKGAVARVMRAYEKGDSAALVEMSSGMILSNGFNELAQLRYGQKLESDLDEFDETVGGKYRIDYSIVGKTRLSERQMKKRLEALVRDGLIRQEDTDGTKGMLSAEVLVTAKRGKAAHEKTLTVVFSKEKGGWKLILLA